MINSGRRKSTWEQLKAIFKYEVLWNVRKKKFLAIFIISLALVSLSIFLPLILGELESNPNFFLNNLNPGNLAILLLAIAISMNSISGEFEEGTIELLASKPISRKVIYSGKLLAMVTLLLIVYIFIQVYTLGVGRLLYGPQHGLNATLLAIPVLLTLSTMVWVSISLVLGSLTKSSITAAIGTFGIFIAIGITGGIVTIFAPESGEVLNYIPGSGETGRIIGQLSQNNLISGMSISTGTDHASELAVFYNLDKGAEIRVDMYEFDWDELRPKPIGSRNYSLSRAFSKSMIVILAYLLGLNSLACFSFKRADVSAS